VFLDQDVETIINLAYNTSAVPVQNWLPHIRDATRAPMLSREEQQTLLKIIRSNPKRMIQQHHDSHIMISNPPLLIDPGAKHSSNWKRKLQNDRVTRNNNGLIVSKEE
jgi:hypothetical protein